MSYVYFAVKRGAFEGRAGKERTKSVTRTLSKKKERKHKRWGVRQSGRRVLGGRHEKGCFDSAIKGVLLGGGGGGDLISSEVIWWTPVNRKQQKINLFHSPC